MKSIREVFTRKRLSGVIVSVVCLGLLAVGLYQKAQVSQAERELNELRHNVRIIERLQDMVPEDTDLTRLPVAASLSQSSGHFGLHPGLSESDDGNVSVSLDPLPFDKLVLWLAELQMKYNVQVMQLQLQPEDEGNRVTVETLILKRTVTG